MKVTTNGQKLIITCDCGKVRETNNIFRVSAYFCACGGKKK